jgi:hypothetical protein
MIDTCFNTRYHIIVEGRRGNEKFQQQGDHKDSGAGRLVSAGCQGRHYFKHKTKPGKIPVPHPEKDVDPKTAKSIFKAAGL